MYEGIGFQCHLEICQHRSYIVFFIMDQYWSWCLSSKQLLLSISKMVIISRDVHRLRNCSLVQLNWQVCLQTKLIHGPQTPVKRDHKPFNGIYRKGWEENWMMASSLCPAAQLFGANPLNFIGIVHDSPKQLWCRECFPTAQLFLCFLQGTESRELKGLGVLLNSFSAPSMNHDVL